MHSGLKDVAARSRNISVHAVSYNALPRQSISYTQQDTEFEKKKTSSILLSPPCEADSRLASRDILLLLETQYSSPCSQELDTRPYPEPDVSKTNPYTLSI